MKQKYIIFIAIAFATIAISVYFFSMFKHDLTNLSPHTQDWGAFGAYVGGIVGSVSGLVAAYFLYCDLKQNTLNERQTNTLKQIDLMRDVLHKYADIHDETTLEKILNIQVLNGALSGKTCKEALGIVAYKHAPNGTPYRTMLPEPAKEAFLCIYHGIAIVLSKANEYILETRNANLDSSLLYDLEMHYWCTRYSDVISRLNLILKQKDIDSFFEKRSNENNCQVSLSIFDIFELTSGHNHK